MNRTRLAVIVAVALVALGVGVAVVATQDSSPNGASAATTSSATDTVGVSGTGTVQGQPDTLVANFRVHALASGVQDALNTSASDARKVVASLRKNGVAGKDIRTTDVSLNQHYDRHGVVDGYESSESLSVRIHPLTHVGQVITAAATSAGNSVNVEGLSFDIADNSSLLAAARANAFNNAKAAASQYATLGGTKLNHVVSIKAVVHNASPIYASAGLSAAIPRATDSTALPIQAGRQKVSVTVNVVWALG
jgi:uncharacterized protein YggE